jgi:hypothetical protein
MAREPQRSEQPRPLGAAIMPVQRALIARAKELEGGIDLTLDGTPAVTGSNVRRLIAAEFRSLAAELQFW